MVQVTTSERYKLCKDFYLFMKNTGNTKCTIAKYQRRLKEKHKVYPNEVIPLTDKEIKIIRLCLSPGHNIFPQLKLYGYQRNKFGKLETIYAMS